MKLKPQSDEHPSPADLLAVPVFSDLQPDQIDWLASHMQILRLEDGEVMAHAGDDAEEMIVFFEGELRAERKDGRLFIAPKGQVTGLIPYSRMTHYSSDARSGGTGRAGILRKELFPEMLERIPVLNERLVGLLSERIRVDASSVQQREKLMALGKMSAGLAHELNNPAAAARRASDNLKVALESMHAASLALEERGLPGPARLFITRLERDWAVNACQFTSLDTLERSEREEEFADWLERHNVDKAWESASALVDAGCTTLKELEEVKRAIPPEFLPDVIYRITAAFTATRLVEEIQSSVSRISELVKAIKEYSYMDQAPEQTVDIHDGLENTLIMLRHRFKNGVDISRHYDRTIPKLHVRGGELNQVWTNLIGNAVDAMQGKGTLTIQTSQNDRFVTVKITDSGPGIPDEIRSRIFEPFFTTKAVGEGTGLGLDVSLRIIKNHAGTIDLDSKPGETSFAVHLPVNKG